jgi:hypothetical protein
LLEERGVEERGVEERGDHFETKAAPQTASPQ